ncbi:hypothetical protein [Fodinibius sediminis]|uniref:Uncharacterized protein n=1 Tax=Fodinibius sediminis TaxID=1214077 RepID=A0A521CXX6_9BACT|nr:hypothetical protein [Fodinibius sediminis]SMO64316.1 hypothetical protein SAMN06265218_1082 [Fodinibius sediminis]
MSDTNIGKDIFKEIDSALEEIGEVVEEKREFAKLHQALSIIENERYRKTLEGILDQVQYLKQNEYTTEAHQEPIGKHYKAGQIFKTKLFPDTSKRFRDLVVKETKYLRMQTSEYNENCGLAIGSVGNLIPMGGEPVKQELYLNALINLIIDFRLSTLPDNQALDFLAQSVLKTKL